MKGFEKKVRLDQIAPVEKEKVGTMLFGLVREIDLTNWDPNTKWKASIEYDTDDFLAMCLYGPNFGCHFGVDGLALADRQIDWLAWEITNQLQKAFDIGYKMRSNEVSEALSGLRDLLE
jgi:hypothetical protein